VLSGHLLEEVKGNMRSSVYYKTNVVQRFSTCGTRTLGGGGSQYYSKGSKYSENYTQIWYSEDRAPWYILIMKANKMHYFSDIF